MLLSSFDQFYKCTAFYNSTTIQICFLKNLYKIGSTVKRYLFKFLFERTMNRS